MTSTDDVMLTDATNGASTRFVSPGAAVRVAAGLARHPDRAARRAGTFGAELTRVVRGRSGLRPGRGNRRYADPAWESSSPRPTPRRGPPAPATLPGSWWPDYDARLAARSGALKPAPKRLGGGRFKALAKAPGSYVHAS